MKWPRRLPPAGTRVSFRDYLATIFGTLVAQHPKERLIDEVRAYFGVRNTLLTNSGRSALVVILRTLAEGDTRKEILIPAYTCFSVPSAVKKAGLRVRIVDLQEKTFDYDFSQLERAITPETLAILLVYPFGLGCDVSRAQQIARDHGIYLIEDVAQSMGLKVGGRYAGTIGDVGFFSLSKGKPITSMRGGIIITNDGSLGRRIAGQAEVLPNAGWIQNLRVMIEAKVVWLFLRPCLYWIIRKLRFVKLGETHYNPTIKVTQMPRTAAILSRRMLRRLKNVNEARNCVAGEYLKKLQGNSAFPVIGVEPEASCFLRLPLLCADQITRDRLFSQLHELGASCMYYKPLYVIDDHELFAGGNPSPASYPNAERISKRLLTLPTHVFVRSEDTETITAVVNGASATGSRVHVSS